MDLKGLLSDSFRRASWANKLMAVLGLLVSVVCVWTFIKTLTGGEILKVVALHLDTVGVMMAALLVAYLARGAKAYLIQRQCGIHLDFAETCRVLFSSIALNNLVPLRAGDLLRIAALSKDAKTTLRQPFISVLVERLFDLGSLLTLLFVWFTPLQAALAHLLAQWHFTGLVGEFIGWVEEGEVMRIGVAAVVVLVLALALVLSRASVVWAGKVLVVAAVQWSIEIILLAYIGQTFIARDLSVEAVITSTIMANLATIIPSAPGYIGTFQLIGALPFMLRLGETPVSIGAFLIALHGAIWLFSTSLGLLSLFQYFGRQVRVRVAS